MIKKFFSLLTPPIFLKIGNIFKPKKEPNENVLFDGDDSVFKKLALNSEVFGEYGCGASTIWVAKNTKTKILSTDTSNAWIETVLSKVGHSDKLNIHHTDLGSLGDWGRPLSYERRDFFSDYTDWIWGQELAPDLVLIDGRFRVCCFLTSVLNASEGAVIVFDDYIDRNQYHIVEEIIPIKEMCGRQAIFVVPNKSALNIELIKTLINRFRYVMD